VTQSWVWKWWELSFLKSGCCCVKWSRRCSDSVARSRKAPTAVVRIQHCVDNLPGTSDAKIHHSSMSAVHPWDISVRINP